MNAIHDSKQNIAKIRGLIRAVRSLDVLKASTSNAILQSQIENAIVLADQSEGALDALELTVGGMPSFSIDSK